MKKIVAFVLTMTLLLMITSAIAVDFTWDDNSTTMSRWSDDTTSVGTTWRVSEWKQSNLGPLHQAAVKIFHQPGVYASHTFYYSNKSIDFHAYLNAYANGQTVYMAGCRYSGSGNITVKGVFDP